MKLLATKLKLALKNSDTTRKELAEYLGVSVAYIGTFCNGHRIPHIDTVLKIEKKLKLLPGYLMYDSILPINESTKIPLLDKKTLDNFLLHDTLPKDVRYIELYTNKEKEKRVLDKCFALIAEGDAMVSTTNQKLSIFDGDTVAIDSSREPTNGCMVAVMIGDDIKIRLYAVDGNDIFLNAADSRIPSTILDEKIKLCGVVIQVTRDI